MWQFHPVSSHAVLAFHGAHGDGVVIGALIAHYPNAAHWQQHGEALPDFVVQAICLHGLDHDGIRIAENLEAFPGDFSKYAHRQSGAGERLAPDNLLGQAQFKPELTHLVLEEAAQWLNQLKLHVLGQAAHVMMALDERGRVASNGH